MIVRELLVKLGFKLDGGAVTKVKDAFHQIRRKAIDLNNVLKKWKPFSKIKGGLDVLDNLKSVFGGVARSLVGTISEFQQLEGQLVTLEQSGEKATAVFVKLQDFAKKTPFQLGKIVQAYATLRGAGIEPTIEEMGLMGDMAAGMGQDITDVSEAFAKASMGNFELLRERLKIAVTQSKGQVTLAFGDFKRTVKKDGKEIRKALLELSKKKFALGMERQLGTLAGQFSNLQDNIASFAKEVGEAGLTKGLLALNEFFKDLTGSAGEKGLAKALGEILGDALKKIVTGLEFVRDNVRLLIGLFKTLIALEVIKWFAGAITAVMTLDKELFKTNVKLLLTSALWLGLFLILQDIVGFFAGHDSIIGDIARKRDWTSAMGLVGQFAQLVINLFDTISDLLVLIIKGFGWFFGLLKDVVNFIRFDLADAIKDLPGGEVIMDLIMPDKPKGFDIMGASVWRNASVGLDNKRYGAPSPRELGSRDLGSRELGGSGTGSTRVVNAPITINPSQGMSEEQVGRAAARHIQSQQSDMTRQELRSQYQSVAEDRSGGVA